MVGYGRVRLTITVYEYPLLKINSPNWRMAARTPKKHWCAAELFMHGFNHRLLGTNTVVRRLRIARHVYAIEFPSFK